MYAHMLDGLSGFCGWFGHGFFWPGGGLLGLFIFILAAGLMVYLFSRLAGSTAGTTGALDVLKKRLAAGEITEEEFERLKKLLAGK